MDVVDRVTIPAHFLFLFPLFCSTLTRDYLPACRDCCCLPRGWFCSGPYPHYYCLPACWWAWCLITCLARTTQSPRLHTLLCCRLPLPTLQVMPAHYLPAPHCLLPAHCPTTPHLPLPHLPPLLHADLHLFLPYLPTHTCLHAPTSLHMPQVGLFDLPTRFLYLPAVGASFGFLLPTLYLCILPAWHALLLPLPAHLLTCTCTPFPMPCPA